MSIKSFTVQDLLEKFKKFSLTNRDAGNKFEVLIKNYFFNLLSFSFFFISKCVLLKAH
jgi:hypothetical protein